MQASRENITYYLKLMGTEKFETMNFIHQMYAPPQYKWE